MSLNKLRDLYAAGKPAVGTFFSAGNASCMECLGYVGLDYVVIDTEHGPFDTMDVQELVRAAEGAGLAPLIRIADVTHKEIQRAADCGAQGIIIPCLRSPEEFKKAVDLAKFAPAGNRGFIKGRGAGFGSADWAQGPMESYFEKSNEKFMVIPQCETAEALERLEEIAKYCHDNGMHKVRQVVSGGATVLNESGTWKIKMGAASAVIYVKSKTAKNYMVTEETMVSVNETKTVLHKNTVVTLTPRVVVSAVSFVVEVILLMSLLPKLLPVVRKLMDRQLTPVSKPVVTPESTSEKTQCQL